MSTKIRGGFINNNIININIKKTEKPISIIVRIHNSVITLLETNSSISFLLEKDGFYSLLINGGFYYQSNKPFSYELEILSSDKTLLENSIIYSNKKDLSYYEIKDNIFVNEVSCYSKL